MILVVATGGFALAEPDRFDGFAVASDLDGDRMLSAEGIEPDGPDHVWVPAALVTRLGERGTALAPADWRAEFDAMIEAVRAYGWVKEKPLRIRGHRVARVEENPGSQI